MSYDYPFRDADEQLKLAVWEKGKEIVEKTGKQWDADIWRWDKYGKVMKYSEHGNTNTENGWEIDHIEPLSKGGVDIIDNLQPLQWENNRKKGDDYPWTP